MAGGGSKRLCKRDSLPKDLDRLRLGLRTPAASFFYLAEEFGRDRFRRSAVSFRQFLLWGIRKQLGGSWSGKKIPRILQLSGSGVERNRGEKLREKHARVEPSSHSLPPCGQARLLPELGAARRVYQRPHHEYGRCQRSQDSSKRGYAVGSAV